MRWSLRQDTGVDPYIDMVEIGVGSFARVFRAVDRDTGQPIALKMLDLHKSRAMSRDLFRREARALGALSTHPHIVTLHRAFIRQDGAPVLVMELCETSLSAAMSRRGALPPQSAVSVTIKLAGALATAHAAGILHRDVKPQNVLITRYGEPALADFGVARMRDTTGTSSPTSAMTLYHAAPEIIVGDVGDERSDLYSLASTLYELLAGHPPHTVTYDEDPLVVQRRVLTDPPPRIRSNDLPVRLQDLLRQALAKQPEARPRTVVELARLLRGIEEAHGWPATDCLVEGRTDLLPLLPAPSARVQVDRAASSTSVPSLGVNTRPFASVDVPEHRLEPAEQRRPHDVRSDRPIVPIRGGVDPTEQRAEHRSRASPMPPSGPPGRPTPGAPPDSATTPPPDAAGPRRSLELPVAPASAIDPGGLSQRPARQLARDLARDPARDLARDPARDAEPGGTVLPARPPTVPAPEVPDDAAVDHEPPAEGFDPVQAVWGYGSEGGTGTVERQDSSAPSRAGDRPEPVKRWRFGRRRAT